MALTDHRRLAVVVALLVILSVPAPAVAADRTTIDHPFAQRNLEKVYPSADSFSDPSGQYQIIEAYNETDDGRELAGYVYLTSNVVDVEGYGNEPIEFLVALDTDGTIRGVELVEQHEPFFDRISAIQRLRRFGHRMVGLSVTQDVVLTEAGSGEYHVDALTGASVTTRSSIETVTRSARIVAREKGIVGDDSGTAPPANDTATNDAAANDSSTPDRPSLDDVRRRTALARWTAGTTSDPNASAPVELYAAPVTSASFGRRLLGNDSDAYPSDPTNATVLWVGVNARGPPARPDSLRVHQWTDSYAPRPHRTHVRGTDWSAVLVVDDGLDTGSPFVLDLTLGGTRVRRTYAPGGLAVRRPVDAAAARLLPAWASTDREAWHDNWLPALALVVMLVGLLGVFAFRSELAAYTGGSVNRLRIGVLGVTLAFLGWYHPTQPTTQQIAILVREVISWATTGGFRWALFFSAPLVALVFIFIAVVIPKWGRGAFCGWICPFGALSELLYLVTPWSYELPREYHVKLEKLRYPIFLAVVAAFVVSVDFGAKLAKVEPFKAAFYSSLVTDPVYIGWSALLVVVGAVVFRPYCRYLCPLGAGLALGNVVQQTPIQRYDLCGDCVKCQSACDFQAIEDDGSIDAYQCFQCSVCVDNYYDPEGCPVVLQYDHEHGITVDAWQDPALIERIRPEDRTPDQQRRLAERAMTDGGDAIDDDAGDELPDGGVVAMARDAADGVVDGTVADATADRPRDADATPDAEDPWSGGADWPDEGGERDA